MKTEAIKKITLSEQATLLPSGYKTIESAPYDEIICVIWGYVDDNPEYGLAKYALGQWWNYSSSNPHANGRACTRPDGWI